jgi:hypothetical protein
MSLIISRAGHRPRDGRNISVAQFVDAIQRAYHISTPLAYMLALGGLALCGRRWFSLHLDLEDLARHNRIEHDASLVHADTPKGDKYAPTAVDGTLLEGMLARCPASGMGFDDFARLRAERETATKRDEQLDGLHRTLGAAEAVLILNTLRDESGTVPKARLEQWLGEERFPDGWQRPAKEQGFLALNDEASKLRKEVQELKNAKRAV